MAPEQVKDPAWLTKPLKLSAFVNELAFSTGDSSPAPPGDALRRNSKASPAASTKAMTTSLRGTRAGVGERLKPEASPAASKAGLLSRKRCSQMMGT